MRNTSKKEVRVVMSYLLLNFHEQQSPDATAMTIATNLATTVFVQFGRVTCGFLELLDAKIH